MHARPSVVHLCVPDVRSSDTQPRPAVLPGIRIHISNSMSSIQRLSSVIIDKDNSTRGTIAGQCLVCIDARSASTPSSATNDNTEGDFAVFDTQQNADTYITAARDALASGSSSTPLPSPTAAPGYILSLMNVNRQHLHHLSSNWTGLCATAPPLPPPPPPHPLVGSCLLNSSSSV